MRFLSPKSTSLQKALVILFLLTIVMACISLVWLQFEKPGKVTRKCTMINQFADANKFTFDKNTSDTFKQLHPECNETANPPMSLGLEAAINLTVIIGVIFVLLSVYAYISRKKPVSQENPPEQPPK
jgi:disulfide bond formation protein DsbB